MRAGVSHLGYMTALFDSKIVSLLDLAFVFCS